jgi:hypothetical protein
LSQSQSMCCIFYRDAYGGRLGLYNMGRKKETASSADRGNDSADSGDEYTDGKSVLAENMDEMIYEPYHEQQYHDDGLTTSTATTPIISLPSDILRLPSMDDETPLPLTGFFAVECTVQHIVVGKQILRKGQSAMLQNGTTIKIASYHFYFLLPSKDNNMNMSPPTMKVKVMQKIPPIKPNPVLSQGGQEHSEQYYNSDNQDEHDADATSPPLKKVRTTTTATTKMEESQLTLFDDRSDVDLLDMLSQRVLDTTLWDHESQKLGSMLAIRACRAAANSKMIQQIDREEGGVRIKSTLFKLLNVFL